MLKPFTLQDFLDESNRIEGMGPTGPEVVEAAQNFLVKRIIDVSDLVDFVKVIQPDAVLRDRRGLNVRVGDHVAPPGGPAIKAALHRILEAAEDGYGDAKRAYEVHLDYETLHPFTDGNGRSGRILWLWMVGGNAPLGFLHHWYYLSLSASRPQHTGRPG